MDITGAFYQRMLNDPTLVAMLAVYDDTATSAGPLPAIFTGPHVPLDATKPWVWTYGSVSDVPDDTKLEHGRKILRDIICATVNDADPTVLDAIVDRVRELFHRYPLAISGATTLVCSVTGPVPAEIEKNNPTSLGQILHVRLRAET